MSIRMWAFTLFFISVKAAVVCYGLKIEATEGEDVTLLYQVDGAGKADNFKIFFTPEGKKEVLIARRSCHNDGCYVVEERGVSLQVKGENVTLTLQHVNRSINTGVYVAQIFIGKNVIRKNITLVVNEPPPAFSPPTQTSSPEPPDPHKRQRLYVLASPVLFTMTVLYLIIKFKMNLYPHPAQNLLKTYYFVGVHQNA